MTRMPQGNLVHVCVDRHRDERRRVRPTVGELDAGLGPEGISTCGMIRCDNIKSDWGTEPSPTEHADQIACQDT